MQTHPQGSTALLVAAAAGQVGVVDVLLELGADPDAKDAEGITALMEAGRAPDGFEAAQRLVAAKVCHRQPNRHPCAQRYMAATLARSAIWPRPPTRHPDVHHCMANATAILMCNR